MSHGCATDVRRGMARASKIVGFARSACVVSGPKEWHITAMCNRRPRASEPGSRGPKELGLVLGKGPGRERRLASGPVAKRARARAKPSLSKKVDNLYLVKILGRIRRG